MIKILNSGIIRSSGSGNSYNDGLLSPYSNILARLNDCEKYQEFLRTKHCSEVQFELDAESNPQLQISNGPKDKRAIGNEDLVRVFEKNSEEYQWIEELCRLNSPFTATTREPTSRSSSPMSCMSRDGSEKNDSEIPAYRFLAEALTRSEKREERLLNAFERSEQRYADICHELIAKLPSHSVTSQPSLMQDRSVQTFDAMQRQLEQVQRQIDLISSRQQPQAPAAIPIVIQQPASASSSSSEVVELRKEVREQSEKIYQLQIEILKNNYESVIGEKSKENESLHRKIKDLTEQVQEKERAESASLKKVNELENKLSESQENFQTTLNLTEDLNTNITSLANENKEPLALNGEAGAKLNQAELSLIESARKINELKDKLETNSIVNSNLETHEMALQNEKDLLKSALQEKETKIEELMQQHAANKDQIQKLEHPGNRSIPPVAMSDFISDNEIAIPEKHEVIQILQQENESLEAEIENIQDMYNSLAMTLDLQDQSRDVSKDFQIEDLERRLKELSSNLQNSVEYDDTHFEEIAAITQDYKKVQLALHTYMKANQLIHTDELAQNKRNTLNQNLLEIVAEYEQKVAALKEKIGVLPQEDPTLETLQEIVDELPLIKNALELQAGAYEDARVRMQKRMELVVQERDTYHNQLDESLEEVARELTKQENTDRLHETIADQKKAGLGSASKARVANDRAHALELQLSKTRKENERLQDLNSKQTRRKEVKELEKKIKGLEQTVQALQAKAIEADALPALKEQIERLREELFTLTTINKTLPLTFAENERLKQRIEVLENAQNNDSDSEVEFLNDHHQKLQELRSILASRGHLRISPIEQRDILQRKADAITLVASAAQRTLSPIQENTDGMVYLSPEAQIFDASKADLLDSQPMSASAEIFDSSEGDLTPTPLESPSAAGTDEEETRQLFARRRPGNLEANRQIFQPVSL